MISFDYSALLGLYGSGASSGAAAVAVRKQPTAPWAAGVKAPEPSALVRAALGGQKFINENMPRLDLPSASTDYKKLFAAYRALETLTALADRAETKGLGASEKALLEKRFAAGMAEVSDWLPRSGLEGVRLAQGQVQTSSKTTAAVPRDSLITVTPPIHEGSPGAVNPAFEGHLTFDVTVTKPGSSQTLNIDLSDMGDTPRSLSNVIAHLNARLSEAGLQSQFSARQVAAEPRTIRNGDRTITLPAGPDRWALSLSAAGSEQFRFSSSQTSDAVQVVQAVGASGAQQVLKFQTGGGAPEAIMRPGEDFWVEGRVSQSALPEGVKAVRASAPAADGAMWVVADLTAGLDGQPIKGRSDVALMKLDSAGRVVSSQVLGAADRASGYALTVAADGRVAVAGSVVGGLEAGKSGDVAGVADSFVTLFDAQGVEQWTQRRGSRGADEATAVQFGADGKVYVAGRAQGGMPGASSSGGWDGYLQVFSETRAHDLAPFKGLASGIAQFGTAADDGVSAIVVEGSDLYAAGVEGGRLIVRRFTLDAEGQPSLSATRDLGLAEGDVAGLAVAGGQVILTGTTRNAALDVGTINAAHQGGRDAFVAVLAGDVSPAESERLTYVGTAGDDTAADAKLVDGKIWLTGVANRPEAAKPTDPTAAYLARVDAYSGTVEWRRDWQGAGLQASPSSLSVIQNGASALDRLGLPSGEIAQSASKTLVDSTSLRVGDRFFVASGNGGRPTAVTIEARDTLQTLTRKIELASGRRIKVTLNSETAVAAKQGEAMSAQFAGLQRLTLTAKDGTDGALLIAGEPGRDALAGLGLTAGFIGPKTADRDAIKTIGLDLPRTLTLDGAEAIKAAKDRLAAAMGALRSAYRALGPQPKAITGAAPEYLQAQIANYQAALNRLGG